MDQGPKSHKREVIAGLAVLIIVVVIVAAAAAKRPTSASTDLVSDTSANTQTVDSASTSNDSSADTSASSTYKDGSYSATGHYISPDGDEDITISVTLQNGIITATSARSGANDPEAEEYQGQFIGGYKQLVVGKNIDSVSLSRVSGSSLTSQGFNNAIQQIKNQAKA